MNAIQNSNDHGEGGRVPFFSACVPVYNGEAYLRECLDSIIQQTFQDFEIVVVDDCSTDGSVALVREYQQHEPRLRLHVNEKNLGLVANWNRCGALAKGTWVKFLFQDDVWASSCLERVHARCAGNSMVFHARKFAFSGAVKPSLVAFYTSDAVRSLPELSDVTRLSEECSCQLICQRPAFNFFGEPSNVAFKREVFEQLGAFDERLVQLCDYEYWTRIASNFGAAFIPEELSTFRVHGGAASTANLETREFRYRQLDRLLVFEKFLTDSKYQTLRRIMQAREPGRLERLLSGQQRIIAQIMRELPSSGRREVSEQLRRYAPGMHDRILGLAKRRFGIVRESVKRVLRRIVGGKQPPRSI